MVFSQMVMPKSYDDLVERLARERDEKRFKPVKRSEAECQAEIAQIQDGAKSSFEGETVIIETLRGPDLELKINVDGSIEGSPAKKKRGRPLGSKNRPKT